MHEFLNGIADAYMSGQEYKSYTFVFPNVRSREYFQYYAKNRPALHCLTMPELIEKACGKTIAGKERQLFILYRAYCNLRKGKPTEPFDRFRYHGQMILKDFDEVDRYLAEPSEIFRNARDYKKIQSFYLTPQQEEIIRTFWGNDPYWKSAFEHRDEAEEVPFWNHVSMNGEPERKFTQLWAILGDLYKEFHRLLDVNNETYAGYAYRLVAQQLQLGNALPFEPNKYVFIGFSRLSHAEHVIFSQLQRQGLAHFYWDYNPTLMNHNNANSAARFIKTYVKEFTSAKPGIKFVNKYVKHHVDIIGVPSNIAQTKVASELLNGDKNTALVLADNELLLPMFASIPKEYEQVNVTMGFPKRFSSLAQLYGILTGMELRSRMDKNGEMTFYHDDVIAFVYHPAVQLAFPEKSQELIRHMRKNHLYNLPQSALTGKFEVLAPFFRGVAKNATTKEVANHLKGLLDYMKEREMLAGIDLTICDKLVESIDTIEKYTSEYSVEADQRTFIDMVERTLNDGTLPLEGKSFEALQVMGVLETRSLGFDNVIMLSMNDTTYPGNDASYSFIPEALRRAYGLPTRDHLEAESAYHFYRILSHADNLTLLYDARCFGLQNGQPSRYITQLTYGKFPGVEVKIYEGDFPAPDVEREPMIRADYKANKEVFKETLSKFTNSKYLKTHRISASDLKKYINCPLEFFLQKINDINPPELEKEETSAADHGNVVHAVAQQVYEFFKERNQPVTREDLDSLIDGGFDNLLERELIRAINIHLVHYPEEVDGKPNEALYSIPLDEKNSLYSNGIKETLISMFKKENTPFTIKATELPVPFTWQITPELSVNFKMIIDRVDTIVEGNTTIHRIIDYKTGKDETSFESVNSLFNIGELKTQRPAIFQLFLYCAAYLNQNPELRPDQVRPMIFKLKETEKVEFGYLKMGPDKAKTSIKDYGMIKAEFDKLMTEMFVDIFDVNKPIIRANDPDCCKFCPFKPMCN